MTRLLLLLRLTFWGLKVIYVVNQGCCFALNFPQQSSIVGYWPCDATSGMANVAARYPVTPAIYYPKLVTNFAGPYGNKSCYSAYSVERDGVPSFEHPKVDIPRSFTLTFYLYTHATGNGTILKLCNEMSAQGIELRYSSTALELWKITWGNAQLLCSATLLRPYEYNFVIVSRDSRRSWLGIGNETASNQFSCEYFEQTQCQGLKLGKDSLTDGLHKTDTISCLLLYDNLYFWDDDVKAVQQGCQQRAVEIESSCLTQQALPRRQSLLRFWPLDSISGPDDVANLLPLDTYWRPRLNTDIDGPFGQACTSFTAYNGVGIGRSSSRGLQFAHDKTTISFFFYVGSFKRAGGIISLKSEGSEDSLDIAYVPPRNLTLSKTRNNFRWSSSILERQAWTFISLSYDSTTKLISIYKNLTLTDEVVFKGNQFVPSPLPVFYLGYGDGVNMKTGDALSCVTLYEETLDETEISQLFMACQARFNSSERERSCVAQQSFPRRNELFAFWPFDAESGLSDLSVGRRLSGNGYEVLTGAKYLGPFGRPETSFTVKYDNIEIGSMERNSEYPDVPYLTSPLTIALYFYTSLMAERGILTIGNHGKDVIEFCFQYAPPNELQIFASSYGGRVYYESVGNSTAVLKPNAWSFIAFTLDVSIRSINLFNEQGIVVDSFALPQWLTGEFNFLNVGSAKVTVPVDEHSTQARSLGMSTTDALACLFLYNTNLTEAEIAKLPRSCDTKGRNETSTDSVKVPSDEGSMEMWKIVVIVTVSTLIVAGVAVIGVLAKMWSREKFREKPIEEKEPETYDLPVITAPPLSQEQDQTLQDNAITRQDKTIFH